MSEDERRMDAGEQTSESVNAAINQACVQLEDVRLLHARFWDAMMAALTKLASDCGTTVKITKCHFIDEVKWSVLINDMRHTVNGEHVDSRNTRTVSLSQAVGPYGPYYLFEIDDHEQKTGGGYWSSFHVRWVLDFDEHKLCIEDRSLTVTRMIYSSGVEREQLYDGMSYQGVSTRLFDDLLQLLGKLATMRVYERAAM